MLREVGSRGLVAVSVALTCSGLLPGISAAQEYVETPPVSVSPIDGATLPPSDVGIPFAMHWPLAGNPTVLPYIEVSQQSIPGQDGTLANDFILDFFSVGESDAFPDLFRGSSRGLSGGRWFTSAPGTYYWQAQASYRDWSADPTVGPIRYVKSPVYVLTIANPTPTPVPGTSAPGPSTVSPSEREPLLRLQTAKVRAKRAIVRKYKAKLVKVTCERASDSAFDCYVRWTARTGKRRFRSVAVFYESRRLKVEILS